MFGLRLIADGLITGAITPPLMPGTPDLSIPTTILIGLIGSFVGGFVGGFAGYLVLSRDASGGMFEPAGINGSIIGPVLVLPVWLRIGARCLIHS